MRAPDNNPEVQAAEQLLSSGDWVPGPSLIRAIGEKVTPGRAERLAETTLKNPDQYSRERKVETGRRHIARERISTRLLSGQWETDPPKLTRGHWMGFETWRIRSAYPGALTVQEACDHLNKIRPDLNLVPGKLLRWVSEGYLPRPARSPGGGVWIITKDLIPAYERVVTVAPVNGRRWSVLPHTLWAAPAQNEVTCPNCGVHLRVSVEAVRKESGASDPVAAQAGSDVDDDPDDAGLGPVMEQDGEFT